jgi:aldehyde:ferredoxin oxidoreductase
MKDCLPVDDFVFPMIYSPNTPDHYCRIGDIEGPSLEYHLFKVGTGTPWSEQEFETATERVYSLERALTVRHWARSRAMDELVLPSFEYLENWQNPMLDRRYGLDREQFKPVMDDYYRFRGWDVDSGWPTREHLDEVGLTEVYEPMVEGALQAREILPEPPEEQPVPLLHG